VITLWHVLEHLADPIDGLRQARQALKPGGLCVVEVPNLRSPKFMLSKTKWRGGNHPLYHRTFFTASSLRAAFVRAGYAVSRRMRWSYRLPDMGRAYSAMKRALDAAALDSFLDFVAWKEPAGARESMPS
jgi:predicted SAM-dependent methyltransferase